MFKLSMTAKAINKITKALGDAVTAAETAEQRAARALKTHIAFRTNLQASLPEVAGYLETLDLLIEVLADPLSSVWEKKNAKAGIGSLNKIIEIFDWKDQFWINDYISSKLGKNLPDAPTATKTTTPGSSKGSLRLPFPSMPAAPSSDVTPSSGRTPPQPPPTTPNTSTGRYKP